MVVFQIYEHEFHLFPHTGRESTVYYFSIFSHFYCSTSTKVRVENTPLNHASQDPENYCKFGNSRRL